MALISKSMHHAHIRKRVSQKLEPYPHPNKWKNLLDKIIYVVGVLSPLMTIPQLFKIWAEQNTSGVSLISWSWYLTASVVWLMYSLAHKEKPLILNSALWVITETFIVIGLLMRL